MKRNLWVGIAALVFVVPSLYASQYVEGTVIEVQKHKVYSPEYTMGGSNPSDAPLTSRYYAYEISIRIDCQTYIGRYETPFNYLTSAFTPNRPVQVRLTKHVMYFDLPNDPDMRMGIVHRRSECVQKR
ncbi:MAG TPA: hypothetical protein VKR57_10550 [Terriglobales bacterium]|jgi:hypothetical protein|nr:hypothetical protein [Terriglobales bacterium]